MLIDTHAHIYSEDYSDDIDQVIERAYQCNVRKIVLPNIDSSSLKSMLDLSTAYPQICFPLIGLHPTSVNEDYRDELQLVDFWLTKRKFFGIGEIGIDLYWDKTFLNEQIIVFRHQLQLAKKYELPVVIHVRDSFEQVFEILLSELDRTLTGVFHSFSGSPEQAKQVIGIGFKIGVNGIVTFKNSGLGSIIQEISPEHLLIETDSPYLTPVPFRGKRNESSYLIYVARKIAELHNTTVDEIARITTENAEKLFGI
ncbi:MAG: hydrolase TatD [Bacteroidetes bacterium GWF2_42_66]|nr:MAG: hydrolase TatD [Bacteroidetes bacterium GWA2_42_15]OFX98359.1 MAG: hydrolase TatD [Bacteroidetes bacterium GWE2_42_39]OFY42744.1 MAG: hydrolase TatD [Bacteroidetes bacterium GWF2_42_66]HBL74354.1 hydrolase TatD [Prolixibacteraceae bacterium]HCR91393.1 hydrolase TatD [Prolixibacteraceae bacterium]